ncbi:MAG: SDR family oxidoreductase [Calditrichales bacterium]|nr:MAG: SDR family oxidoreductase [Calditrichales bacterium]
MEKKTVFITGASSGIGLACAHRFAETGANLLLCARRKDRIDKIVLELASRYKIKVHGFALDVRKQKEVDLAWDSLPEEWKAIDILVNNAGLASGFSKLHEGNISDWDDMIDTNIKGLLYITRRVVPEMVRLNRGDIVNIGSIAGHEVYPNGNVYCATKYAVKALTQGLRIDLVGTPIRVSTVDPGMVETEFSIVRFHGDKNKADSVYKGLSPLAAEDIAETVYFCVSRPKHVQIAEIVVLPTAQKSAVIVHRDS